MVYINSYRRYKTFKICKNSDSYIKEIQRLMIIMAFRKIDRGFEVCKNVQ